MSYILEALKKSSEERRRRQQEEELQSPLLLDHAVSPKNPGKKRLLPLLLIIAFAVLSLLSWQFFSANDDDPASRLNPGQAAPINPAQKPEITTTDGLQPDTAPPPEQLAEETSAAETEDTAVQGASFGNPEQKTEPGLVLFEDLPLAIRAQLPEMKYSGHVFSPNPQLRMILINTTVVREGDLIDSDTRLVEITGDGLVMSYKDTIFKVVLF